jgi:electron transfer flavoprotein alpha subunit
VRSDVAVLSYSDDPSLAGEVAAAGLELANSLGTEALAVELDEVSPGLRVSQDVLLVRSDARLEADTGAAASAMGATALANGFHAVLVAESRFGGAVAGRLAARLRVASLGRCKGIRVEGGRIRAWRDVYGGRFCCEVSSSTPCVVMVQQGAYQASGGAPRVRSESHEPARSDARVLEVRPTTRAVVDIKSAERIVAVGRGFAKKEDLSIGADLADALGAAMGCSRPLSSDLGWMGEDQHIGLTGAYVHPRLYVAVGISGQLQHIAGIRDSRTVVAINKDRQAPIFQSADYGIVGDLYDLLPELTRALKER